MAKDALVTDSLAAKFASEKDSPYTRWVAAEGLDIIAAHYVADLRVPTALVVSTISLAHSLGLRMVAEGVENATALSELTRHGCDQAQGYYLSRPIPAAELELWLDERSQLERPALGHLPA